VDVTWIYWVGMLAFSVFIIIMIYGSPYLI